MIDCCCSAGLLFCDVFFFFFISTINRQLNCSNWTSRRRRRPSSYDKLDRFGKPRWLAVYRNIWRPTPFESRQFRRHATLSLYDPCWLHSFPAGTGSTDGHHLLWQPQSSVAFIDVECISDYCPSVKTILQHTTWMELRNESTTWLNII